MFVLGTSQTWKGPSWHRSTPASPSRSSAAQAVWVHTKTSRIRRNQASKPNVPFAGSWQRSVTTGQRLQNLLPWQAVNRYVFPLLCVHRFGTRLALRPWLTKFAATPASTFIAGPMAWSWTAASSVETTCPADHRPTISFWLMANRNASVARTASETSNRYLRPCWIIL